MLHSAGRALLTVLLLLGSSRAWAEGEITPEAQARARMHFQQGKAAFELGNFQEALDQYKTAYRIAPLPGFLFNLGQCHRNLKQYEKAIFAFRSYLRKRPEAQNRDAVLLLIKELQRKIEERDRQKVPIYVPESRPITDTNPPPPPPTPIYKRWWLWTLVAVAAGGAAVGIYFGARSREPGIPDSRLGVWDVRPTH
jgi:tetratricopeptide (TPR) repeat protein